MTVEKHISVTCINPMFKITSLPHDQIIIAFTKCVVTYKLYNTAWATIPERAYYNNPRKFNFNALSPGGGGHSDNKVVGMCLGT